MNTSDSFRISWLLSWLITGAATVAAAGGLLIPGLYRDNTFVRAAWWSNDLITLFVAVPVLAVALLLSGRGSRKAQLVWLGMLGYMLYNYAFYLFGAAFNEFFLLYVALFILPVYALILGLDAADPAAVGSRFAAKTPVKWLSMGLLLIVVPLSAMELSQTFNFILHGVRPQILEDSGLPVNVVFALDLSIVVPAMYLTAILLWKRRNWGLVLSVILLIKGFSYMLVLLLASATMAGWSLAGTWDPFTPFYLFVAVVSLLCCGVLFRNYNTI